MKNILLIAEERERSGLADTLRGFGHEVIVAQDRESGLSIIRESGAVHLVIYDCRADGMGGPELLAALKKSAPALPSIVLASDGSIESYLEALSLGAFEYLNKPVNTKELGRIVNAALAMKRPPGHSDPAIYDRKAS
jgi:two-component system response regulator (stage 0 sporulation protein F)